MEASLNAAPDEQQSSSTTCSIIMERLGRLGVNQSSLSPHITALLAMPPIINPQEASESGIISDFYNFVTVDDENENVESSKLVPLLKWDKWTKRTFISVEDEEKALECARNRERKSDEWVEAYYMEFARLALQVKHAALVLHHHFHQHPLHLHQLQWLLPRLTWLRASDEGWADHLRAERERSPLIACTMLTTYLEKALGDLLCWSTNGRQRVPCRISDLLVEPALADLLGADAVYVVRCVLGPPNGLNLRNLL